MNTEKLEFFKTLEAGYKTLYSKDMLAKRMKELQEQIMCSQFKGDVKFVPKANLSFREYMAIKNYFSETDFARTSYLSLSFPCAVGILYSLHKIGKRLKYL